MINRMTSQYIEAIEHGFSPIPLNGKIPVVKSWNDKDNSFFLYVLEKHHGNIGIRTGQRSQIIILDCDKPRANTSSATDGNEDFNSIVMKETGKTSLSLDTVIDQSGSDSYRFYFRYNRKHKYESKIKKCNIDVLADGKQAVYNGSVYAGCCPKGENKHKCGTKDLNVCLYEGNKYKWFKSPVTQTIMEIPEWLLKYIVKPEKKVYEIEDYDEESLNSINIGKDEMLTLTEHIADGHFTDYTEWRDLIWLLVKLGLPRQSIQELSMKAENYCEDSTDAVINSYNADKNKMTIGTLFHYLKKDLSKKKYKELCYPYLVDRILDKQIESLFTLKETQFVKVQDIPTTTQWVEDIVFPTEKRCVGIRMALGGGKTTALIRLVQSMPSDAKVLILSPRITFSTNICAEYNSQLDETRQFTSYINQKKQQKSMKQLNFKNKIVMSMEGLHYLESYTPDLLIIDEVNANLIAHVTPETNGKNLDNNLYHFRRMLEYSDRVVVADAFLGEKVINFFTDLKIPLHIYNYLRKLPKRTAVCQEIVPDEVNKAINKEFSSLEVRAQKKMEVAVIPTMKRLLKEKRKIYSFFSTKNDLEIVEEKFRKKYNTVFYSGTSQNEIPEDLNVGWDGKDLVGTTSTITVGCSHNKKDVFDNILITFNAASKNYVADAIQSHYRVRYLKDPRIYVFTKDCYIAPNTPVNKYKIRSEFDRKEGWFKKMYKGFEPTEDYVKKLILHNKFEHQLSFKASTKMMKRYLTDCNYDIIGGENDDDDEEEENEEEETVEEEEKSEKFDIIQEYKNLKVDLDTVYKLKAAKLIRKLSKEERGILDKYWFMKIYIAKNDPNMCEYKLPTLALAYSLWKCKFKGDPTLRSMREEKKVLEGITTIEKLAEKRFDKHSIAGLHNSDIIKIARIVEVCKVLGLRHCNDTQTIISQETIDKYYADCKDDYSEIQRDFGIEDKRKVKGEPTLRNFKGLLESAFTNSHSFCALKVNSERRVQVDGKRVKIKDYKLEIANKELQDNIKELEMICKKDNIRVVENPADELYEMMELGNGEDDEVKHKRLLR